MKRIRPARIPRPCAATPPSSWWWTDRVRPARCENNFAAMVAAIKHKQPNKINYEK
jgi:hypothetical protein